MNATDDLLADEDMEFLNQIAGTLSRRHRKFKLHLSGNTCLTNDTSGMFTFTGIDQILKSQQAFQESFGQEVPKMQLVMPTTTMRRKEIGEMLGMVVIVDPDCPADKFYIQEYNKAT